MNVSFFHTIPAHAVEITEVYSHRKNISSNHLSTYSVISSVKVLVSRNFCQMTQCGNFRIFLSLRFYVKSILEILEVLKLPFFHFRHSEFCWIGKFQPLKCAKIHKNQNSEPPKVSKRQIMHSRILKIDFT